MVGHFSPQPSQLIAAGWAAFFAAAVAPFYLPAFNSTKEAFPDAPKIENSTASIPLEAHLHFPADFLAQSPCVLCFFIFAIEFLVHLCYWIYTPSTFLAIWAFRIRSSLRWALSQVARKGRRYLRVLQGCIGGFLRSLALYTGTVALCTFLELFGNSYAAILLRVLVQFPQDLYLRSLQVLSDVFDQANINLHSMYSAFTAMVAEQKPNLDNLFGELNLPNTLIPPIAPYSREILGEAKTLFGNTILWFHGLDQYLERVSTILCETWKEYSHVALIITAFGLVFILLAQLPWPSQRYNFLTLATQAQYRFKENMRLLHALSFPRVNTGFDKLRRSISNGYQAVLVWMAVDLPNAYTNLAARVQRLGTKSSTDAAVPDTFPTATSRPQTPDTEASAGNFVPAAHTKLTSSPQNPDTKSSTESIARSAQVTSQLSAIYANVIIYVQKLYHKLFAYGVAFFTGIMSQGSSICSMVAAGVRKVFEFSFAFVRSVRVSSTNLCSPARLPTQAIIAAGVTSLLFILYATSAHWTSFFQGQANGTDTPYIFRAVDQTLSDSILFPVAAACPFMAALYSLSNLTPKDAYDLARDWVSSSYDAAKWVLRLCTIHARYFQAVVLWYIKMMLFQGTRVSRQPSRVQERQTSSCSVLDWRWLSRIPTIAFWTAIPSMACFFALQSWYEQELTSSSTAIVVVGSLLTLPIAILVGGLECSQDYAIIIVTASLVLLAYYLWNDYLLGSQAAAGDATLDDQASYARLEKERRDIIVEDTLISPSEPRPTVGSPTPRVISPSSIGSDADIFTPPRNVRPRVAQDSRPPVGRIQPDIDADLDFEDSFLWSHNTPHDPIPEVEVPYSDEAVSRMITTRRRAAPKPIAPRDTWIPIETAPIPVVPDVSRSQENINVEPEAEEERSSGEMIASLDEKEHAQGAPPILESPSAPEVLPFSELSPIPEALPISEDQEERDLDFSDDLPSSPALPMFSSQNLELESPPTNAESTSPIEWAPVHEEKKSEEDLPDPEPSASLDLPLVEQPMGPEFPQPELSQPIQEAEVLPDTLPVREEEPTPAEEPLWEAEPVQEAEPFQEVQPQSTEGGQVDFQVPNDIPVPFSMPAVPTSQEEAVPEGPGFHLPQAPQPMFSPSFGGFEQPNTAFQFTSTPLPAWRPSLIPPRPPPVPFLMNFRNPIQSATPPESSEMDVDKAATFEGNAHGETGALADADKEMEDAPTNDGHESAPPKDDIDVDVPSSPPSPSQLPIPTSDMESYQNLPFLDPSMDTSQPINFDDEWFGAGLEFPLPPLPMDQFQTGAPIPQLPPMQPGETESQDVAGNLPFDQNYFPPDQGNMSFNPFANLPFPPISPADPFFDPAQTSPGPIFMPSDLPGPSTYPWNIPTGAMNPVLNPADTAFSPLSAPSNLPDTSTYPFDIPASTTIDSLLTSWNTANAPTDASTFPADPFIDPLDIPAFPFTNFTDTPANPPNPTADPGDSSVNVSDAPTIPIETPTTPTHASNNPVDASSNPVENPINDDDVNSDGLNTPPATKTSLKGDNEAASKDLAPPEQGEKDGSSLPNAREEDANFLSKQLYAAFNDEYDDKKKDGPPEPLPAHLIGRPRLLPKSRRKDSPATSTSTSTSTSTQPTGAAETCPRPPARMPALLRPLPSCEPRWTGNGDYIDRRGRSYIVIWDDIFDEHFYTDEGQVVCFDHENYPIDSSTGIPWLG